MSSIFSFIRKILDISKKIFLVIAIYFVVISLFAYFINKDKPKVAYDPIKKNREEIYKIINDPELNKTQEGKLTIAVYRAMVCGMIGEACTDNPTDGDKNFDKSLFGFMTNLIVLPYANPPASGVYWAYSGLQNAGFIPKTYAAEGIGFAAIRPFINLWQVFRNLAYMLLVLILITIGFMIMFRMKLNPQTVISVENALPKIVISLLLITFSFAIAGFLIDLMYVVILLVIAILGNRGNFFNITGFQNKYINANLNNIGNLLLPSGIISSLWQVGDSLMAIIPYLLNQILRIITGVVGTILVFRFIEPPLFRSIIDSISEFGGQGALPGIGQGLTAIEILLKISGLILLPLVGFGLGYIIFPLIIFILVLLTFVFLLFRIFFMLFATYIRIFLMIVFSPLILLLEAFPGKNTFGFWLKNLFVDILTFPIVITLTVLAYLIVNIIPSYGNIWRPPFLTELNPQAFTVLLGMGLFFMTPDLVKVIKELLGAKGLPISFSPGVFFAGAGAAISGVSGGVGMFTSLTQMPWLGPWLMRRAEEGKGPLAKVLKGILPTPVGEQAAKGVIKALKEEGKI